MNVSFQITSFP